MRYPEPLKQGGTIGFIAPSFGCAIEPYQSRFKNACKILEEKGFKLYFGPNCYESSGLGISNSPDKCGAELNDAMTDEGIDAIITCGGGELMCEVVPYIDFEKIKAATPKWYMGYSDNTNFTFLSTILADTAAIYGPCAPTFGREPWHDSVTDSLKLLMGEIDSVSGYPYWEKDEIEVAEGEEQDPYLPYNATEKTVYQYFVPGKTEKIVSGETITENAVSGENSVDTVVTGENLVDTVVSGDSFTGKVEMKGRLIGGCVDILSVLMGTKYDKTTDFLEKYKDDGFIWFLECCDLDPLSVRRAFWSMREAGWFKYVNGFLIGRPRHFGEEALGVDMYNAITDIIGELGVPVIMDTDIGHKPPAMPIISGGYAEVEAEGNHLEISYKFI